MEELDNDAQQRRETFARYGLAMYNAQCVEKSLAILVSSVFNKEFLPSNPNRREEIQDEIFSINLGKLLTSLRKQVTVPSNLNSMLEDARHKRNWLAHDYFFDRSSQLMTTRGRGKMIKELTVLSEFFTTVDAHLASIYERWCKKIGLPQTVLDENIMKRIQENE